MSTHAAIRARSEWLAHLRYCTQCPTDLCDRGIELAAAVEESMAPGEFWQGVWKDPDRLERPAQWVRDRRRKR